MLPLPSPLPTLPHPNPSSCQSPRLLRGESGRWLFLFPFGKEQTLKVSSEYIQIVQCLRVTEYCKLGLPPFLLMALSVSPESRIDSCVGTWSHSRDFCSEESRCEQMRG